MLCAHTLGEYSHGGPIRRRNRVNILTTDQSDAGLVVPPVGTSIRAGEETRNWEEGKCLVFDDSFEHEVNLVGPP
eukprot:5407857-Pyramimonas_sp.AAC.2